MTLASLGIRKSFAPLTMTAEQVSVTELNQESGSGWT
jgi:hypothetical protein